MRESKGLKMNLINSVGKAANFVNDNLLPNSSNVVGGNIKNQRKFLEQMKTLCEKNWRNKGLACTRFGKDRLQLNELTNPDQTFEKRKQSAQNSRFITLMASYTYKLLQKSENQDLKLIMESITTLQTNLFCLKLELANKKLTGIDSVADATELTFKCENIEETIKYLSKQLSERLTHIGEEEGKRYLKTTNIAWHMFKDIKNHINEVISIYAFKESCKDEGFKNQAQKDFRAYFFHQQFGVGNKIKLYIEAKYGCYIIDLLNKASGARSGKYHQEVLSEYLLEVTRLLFSDENSATKLSFLNIFEENSKEKTSQQIQINNKSQYMPSGSKKLTNEGLEILQSLISGIYEIKTNLNNTLDINETILLTNIIGGNGKRGIIGAMVEQINSFNQKNKLNVTIAHSHTSRGTTGYNDIKDLKKIEGYFIQDINKPLEKSEKILKEPIVSASNLFWVMQKISDLQKASINSPNLINKIKCASIKVQIEQKIATLEEKDIYTKFIQDALGDDAYTVYTGLEVIRNQKDESINKNIESNEIIKKKCSEYFTSLFILNQKMKESYITKMNELFESNTGNRALDNILADLESQTTSLKDTFEKSESVLILKEILKDSDRIDMFLRFYNDSKTTQVDSSKAQSMLKLADVSNLLKEQNITIKNVQEIMLSIVSKYKDITDKIQNNTAIKNTDAEFYAAFKLLFDIVTVKEENTSLRNMSSKSFHDFTKLYISTSRLKIQTNFTTNIKLLKIEWSKNKINYISFLSPSQLSRLNQIMDEHYDTKIEELNDALLLENLLDEKIIVTKMWDTYRTHLKLVHDIERKLCILRDIETSSLITRLELKIKFISSLYNFTTRNKEHALLKTLNSLNNYIKNLKLEQSKAGFNDFKQVVKQVDEYLNNIWNSDSIVSGISIQQDGLQQETFDKINFNQNESLKCVVKKFNDCLLDVESLDKIYKNTKLNDVFISYLKEPDIFTQIQQVVSTIWNVAKLMTGIGSKDAPKDDQKLIDSFEIIGSIYENDLNKLKELLGLCLVLNDIDSEINVLTDTVKNSKSIIDLYNLIVTGVKTGTTIIVPQEIDININKNMDEQTHEEITIKKMVSNVNEKLRNIANKFAEINENENSELLKKLRGVIFKVSNELDNKTELLNKVNSNTLELLQDVAFYWRKGEINKNNQSGIISFETETQYYKILDNLYKLLSDGISKEGLTTIAKNQFYNMKNFLEKEINEVKKTLGTFQQFNLSLDNKFDKVKILLRAMQDNKVDNIQYDDDLRKDNINKIKELIEGQINLDEFSVEKFNLNNFSETLMKKLKDVGITLTDHEHYYFKLLLNDLSNNILIQNISNFYQINYSKLEGITKEFDALMSDIMDIKNETENDNNKGFQLNTINLSADWQSIENTHNEYVKNASKQLIKQQEIHASLEDCYVFKLLDYEFTETEEHRSSYEYYIEIIESIKLLLNKNASPVSKQLLLNNIMFLYIRWASAHNIKSDKKSKDIIDGLEKNLISFIRGNEATKKNLDTSLNNLQLILNGEELNKYGGVFALIKEWFNGVALNERKDDLNDCYTAIQNKLLPIIQKDLEESNKKYEDKLNIAKNTLKNIAVYMDIGKIIKTKCNAFNQASKDFKSNNELLSYLEENVLEFANLPEDDFNKVLQFDIMKKQLETVCKKYGFDIVDIQNLKLINALQKSNIEEFIDLLANDTIKVVCANKITNIFDIAMINQKQFKFILQNKGQDSIKTLYEQLNKIFKDNLLNPDVDTLMSFENYKLLNEINKDLDEIGKTNNQKLLELYNKYLGKNQQSNNLIKSYFERKELDKQIIRNAFPNSNLTQFNSSSLIECLVSIYSSDKIDKKNAEDQDNWLKAILTSNKLEAFNQIFNWKDIDLEYIQKYFKLRSLIQDNNYVNFINELLQNPSQYADMKFHHLDNIIFEIKDNNLYIIPHVATTNQELKHITCTIPLTTQSAKTQQESTLTLGELISRYASQITLTINDKQVTLIKSKNTINSKRTMFIATERVMINDYDDAHIYFNINVGHDKDSQLVQLEMTPTDLPKRYRFLDITKEIDIKASLESLKKKYVTELITQFFNNLVSINDPFDSIENKQKRDKQQSNTTLCVESINGSAVKLEEINLSEGKIQYSPQNANFLQEEHTSFFYKSKMEINHTSIKEKPEGIIFADNEDEIFIIQNELNNKVNGKIKQSCLVFHNNTLFLVSKTGVYYLTNNTDKKTNLHKLLKSKNGSVQESVSEDFGINNLKVQFITPSNNNSSKMKSNLNLAQQLILMFVYMCQDVAPKYNINAIKGIETHYKFLLNQINQHFNEVSKNNYIDTPISCNEEEFTILKQWRSFLEAVGLNVSLLVNNKMENKNQKDLRKESLKNELITQSDINLAINKGFLGKF